MESRIVLIWSAGDQLPGFVSHDLRTCAQVSLTFEDVEADAA